jgi:two-component system chemotaxis response regulator CheY
MDRLGHSLAREVERSVAALTRPAFALDYQRAGMARRTDLEALLDDRPDPVVAMISPLTGSVGGCVILFGKEPAMRRIAGSLLNGDRTVPEGLDDRSVSALRECANVMGNTSLNAMNHALGLSMIPSPPRMLCVTEGNLWRLVDESLWPDDKCLFWVSLRVTAADGADATLMVVAAVPSIDRMLESLSSFYNESDPAAVPAMALLGPGEGERSGSGGTVASTGSFTWEPVPGFQTSRSRLKVLVVDDSVYFRTKTVRWLRSNGFKEVMESADGASALGAYRDHRPDVVLLDIVMEGKSGVEVLREIKAIDPGARIVVVSAAGQELLKEECLRQGALGFLVKPVSGDRLAAEVQRATGR